MTTVQQSTMQAITYRSYGTPEVLELTELATPSINDDQVLIRVRASSVNAMEWHLVTGEPYLVRGEMGLRRPKRPILGADVAGRVVAAGANVIDLAVGDAVFGEIGGAYAEFAVGAPGNLALIPDRVTFEQAAAAPVAGLTALQGLRDHGGLEAGQHVLIVGASGGVGSFAVQIAKALGAEITAVCSTRNVEQARRLGADHVIDYTQADFADSSYRYDVILDIVGTRPLRRLRSLLRPEGTYVMVSGPKGRWLGPVPRMVRGLAMFAFGRRRFAWFVAKANRSDLTFLAELMADGRMTPAIEATYALGAVPEALARLGEGHSQGKAVIVVAGAEEE